MANIATQSMALGVLKAHLLGGVTALRGGGRGGTRRHGSVVVVVEVVANVANVALVVVDGRARGEHGLSLRDARRRRLVGAHLRTAGGIGHGVGELGGPFANPRLTRVSSYACGCRCVARPRWGRLGAERDISSPWWGAAVLLHMTGRRTSM